MLAAPGCAARHSAALPDPSGTSGARSAGRTGAPAVRALQSDLAQVFGAQVMAQGTWGVDVRSLDTGERLYQLDADKLMMPASNMKILTVAAAAEILGWDHRFTTTLETTAPIDNGVLRGDLIVRGTGDPTINTREGRATAVFDEWAAALESAGIRAVDGNIVGDDGAFDGEGIGAGWAWDYLQYGYAAPVGALQFNEDIADLTIEAGAAVGDPAAVRLTSGSGLILLNRATTGPSGSENTIDYRRHLERPVLEITGSIPAGVKPDVRAVAVVNPTIFFAQALKDALASRGIATRGDAVDLDDVAAQVLASGAVAMPRRVIATSTSPPLRDIATVLMKFSQNLYAETLLKAVGAATAGLGTAQAGQTAVHKTLTAWGIADDRYVQADGSGLSRYNYVTPATVTAVLEHVYRDPRHREAFLATLAIAGKDGTIAARMKRTSAEGNAVAKTGSIANVRTLSGFVRTRDGEMLVFSILANDFVISSTTVNWIADLAIEILSNFSRSPTRH